MFIFQLLRSDRPDSADELIAYLSEDNGSGLRERRRTDVMRAIRDGLAVVVRRDGRICGCALVYQISKKGSRRVYSELGTMKVSDNGHGLQAVMARVLIASLVVWEFAPDDHVIYAVVPPESASERNLHGKVGMRPWPPETELIYLRGADGRAFDPSKVVLRAEPATCKGVIRDLLASSIGNGILKLKGSETVKMDIEWFSEDRLNQLQSSVVVWES